MGLAASLVLAALLLQVPYPRRVPAPNQSAPGGADTAAIATFDGRFKTADKKYLTIEVEEGQIMRMYITGSTKFFRDGKPAKAAEFHTDEPVTVDASRDARLNLLAVRVEYSSKPPAKAPEHSVN